MLRPGRLLSLIAIVSAALAAAGAIAASKKPPAPVAPTRLPVAAHARVYAPHEGAGMHTHSAGRFIYVIAGGKMRVQSAEGQLREVEFVEGQGAFRAPERHALENIGLGTLRLLEFDMLRAGAKDVSPDDSVDLGPPKGVVPGPDLVVAFTNRWGSLIRHRVPPEAIWRPARPDHDTFVYRLTRAETMQLPDDGIERRRTEQAGFAWWAPAGEAVPWTNVGREPADLLELSLESRSVLFRPTVITGAPSGAGF